MTVDALTLMVVHAHPDDEVFSTGGTLATYARKGVRTVVVYCTNGEEGELHGELGDADKPRLGEIRREEALRACSLLGVAHVEFLGYRDSGMKDSDANNDPRSFMQAPVDEAANRLMALIGTYEPQVLVTYDESGGYGHPDHIMANRVVKAAFERAQQLPFAPRKLYYTARSRESFRQYVELLRSAGLNIPWVKDDFDFEQYGIPQSQITATIRIAQVSLLKKHSLAVHRSQIKPDSFYLNIPDDLFELAQGEEHFMRAVPSPKPGEHETDLFAGVRDAEVAA